MSFEEWKEKYVKGWGLHIDEDMAVEMYNAVYDFGYEEGHEQGKEDGITEEVIREADLRSLDGL